MYCFYGPHGRPARSCWPSWIWAIHPFFLIVLYGNKYLLLTVHRNHKGQIPRLAKMKNENWKMNKNIGSRNCHIRIKTKSLNAKTDISIFINLRYLRLKLLKNNENNKKICHIFHHNFKDIPCYVMSKVSLKRVYIALFYDGLTLKTLKLAFIGFLHSNFFKLHQIQWSWCHPFLEENIYSMKHRRILFIYLLLFPPFFLGGGGGAHIIVCPFCPNSHQPWKSRSTGVGWGGRSNSCTQERETEKKSYRSNLCPISTRILA